MTHEIKCSGGCGKVLASIELEDGQVYQGDTFFGMYCEDCPKPNIEDTPLP